MDEYHLRRQEKAMTARGEMLDIIRGQKYMTLAMCSDNKPYLATVNYGYDEKHDVFFFHCASTGRKVDYLRSNPMVWGQIIEDNGHVKGECDHAYRTVQFGGRVEFIESAEGKRSALKLMLAHLEKDRKGMRLKKVDDSRLERMAVCMVKVEGMSGKKNSPKVKTKSI
jgi:nitroimidazol reductase NimA-like FMN-containing flavoprotein (pyridoxamine 5'-phosphate oxidase superfamily)